MFDNTNAVVLPIVLPLLFLLGCAYSLLVYSLGERKAGYVSYFVFVGVLITLGGMALVDWRAAVLALVCFAASGTPMVAGEIIQHMRDRDRSIQRHRERAEREVDERQA